MNELISIIVPVYNSEKFLRECLDSLLAQTYKNLEIICINDGSSDSSGAICEEYKSKFENVVIFHQENKGVCAARNKGIDLARGEYIAFVDSDDVVPPDAIEFLYSKIKEYSAEISTGVATVQVSENITKTGSATKTDIVFEGNENVIKNIVSGRFHSACSKLFSKNVISDIRFVEGRKINEDGYFVFQVLMNCKKMVCTDKVVYNYLYHSSSASHASFSDKYYDILYFRDRKIEEIKEKYPEKTALREAVYVMHNKSFLDILIRARDKSLDGEILKIRKEISEHSRKAKGFDSKNRLKLFLIKYFFNVYKKILLRGI